MHFYLHILTDTERLRDPDGQDCANLDEAQLEASQSARALMAQALDAGRSVPLGWRIQIADAEDTVLATISLAALIFGKDAPVAVPLPVATSQELIASARETIAVGKQRGAAIRDSLREAHIQLRNLARLNVALGKTLT